nr:hypothetical protein [Kandleria vitulina]
MIENVGKALKTGSPRFWYCPHLKVMNILSISSFMLCLIIEMNLLKAILKKNAYSKDQQLLIAMVIELFFAWKN